MKVSGRQGESRNSAKTLVSLRRGGRNSIDGAIKGANLVSINRAEERLHPNMQFLQYKKLQVSKRRKSDFAAPLEQVRKEERLAAGSERKKKKRREN